MYHYYILLYLFYDHITHNMSRNTKHPINIFKSYSITLGKTNIDVETHGEKP